MVFLTVIRTSIDELCSVSYIGGYEVMFLSFVPPLLAGICLWKRALPIFFKVSLWDSRILFYSLCYDPLLSFSFSYEYFKLSYDLQTVKFIDIKCTV